MVFKKTTEYAFRVMSLLAMNKEKLHTTSDIHQSLQIPLRYLRKQMTILTKKGLITSVQGKHGGYRLAKSRKEITLWDIVDALEDGMFETSCFFGYKNCALNAHCFMHNKWADVIRRIEDVLKSTTLDLLKNAGVQELNMDMENDTLLT